MRPFQPKTIIEPFRIRSVEPIPFVNEGQRQESLRRAGITPSCCTPTRFNRPADRQWNRRHVLAPVGRDDRQR